jgi:hypothetical protein
VPVTIGSVVMPGEEIARIAPGPYYLRLSLPERHAAEIVQGSKCKRRRARPRPAAEQAVSSIHQGRIAKVYPEIENGRVIADVEVEAHRRLLRQ